MLANLSDIQAITAALAVLDMPRVAQTADALAARETYISTLDMQQEVVRTRHGSASSAPTSSLSSRVKERPRSASIRGERQSHRARARPHM
jgi:hypothetical protein